MEKKVTKKFIKSFNAVDITNINSEDCKALRNKEQSFTTVAMSYGVYGMTGAILEGYTSKNFIKLLLEIAIYFTLLLKQTI